MERYESSIYQVNIPTPVEDLANQQANPSLTAAAANLATQQGALADLLNPIKNPILQAAMPDLVQPLAINPNPNNPNSTTPAVGINTTNPIFPFTLDPGIIAQQAALPFDQQLQQQSNYNGNIAATIAPELAPLASTGTGLDNPANLGINQDIPTQILNFSQNPPSKPGSDLAFLAFLAQFESTFSSFSKAATQHRDQVKAAVKAANNVLANKASAIADLNARTNFQALMQYKNAVKNFFLDGKMPSLPWIKTPTLPTTNPPTIPNVSLTSQPTFPQLPGVPAVSNIPLTTGASK